MRRMFAGMAGLLVLGLLATPALAQRGGGGRGMGGGAMMLGLPQVQEELKLSDEQKEKVQGVVEELRGMMQEKMAALGDLSPEERQPKMRELMAEVNEKGKESLAKLLEEKQIKRLDQIELQVRGVAAFTEAKVQEALKMTEEQKEKIAALESELNAKRGEIMREAQGDFQAAMTKFNAMRTEAETKLMALMSDEQKTKWKEMIGEKFELQFGPGGGGGRRGPGGGN